MKKILIGKKCTETVYADNLEGLGVDYSVIALTNLKKLPAYILIDMDKATHRCDDLQDCIPKYLWQSVIGSTSLSVEVESVSEAILQLTAYIEHVYQAGRIIGVYAIENVAELAELLTYAKHIGK
jgi:hypothetical protein